MTKEEKPPLILFSADKILTEPLPSLSVNFPTSVQWANICWKLSKVFLHMKGTCAGPSVGRLSVTRQTSKILTRYWAVRERYLWIIRKNCIVLPDIPQADPLKTAAFQVATAPAFTRIPLPCSMNIRQAKYLEKKHLLKRWAAVNGWCQSQRNIGSQECACLYALAWPRLWKKWAITLTVWYVLYSGK